MPKASKKRKEKAADFAKAKLKLGKGKQLPSNAVDTSFKAKSIALPTQRIAADQDTNVPTTKRKLTFDDLLSHLKHYNANTRKDGILGIRELLDTHPELIEPHLTELLNACVRLIGDEDASVRKILLQYLSFLLPKIPLDSIRPHCPLLMLFTTSAQTHIFPEIRIDAIRFLDVFLDIIPETVVAGWTESSGTQGHSHGGRVLEGYLGILNAGTTYGESGDAGPVRATSTASVTLSPASKLVVLSSLSTFLAHAIVHGGSSSRDRRGSGSSSASSWFMSSSFSTQASFEAFDQVLLPSSSSTSYKSEDRQWQEQFDMESTDEAPLNLFNLAHAHLGDEITLQELSHIANVPSAVGDATTIVVIRIARALHSTILATLLDCAPLVFSPTGTPQEVPMKTMAAAVRIIYHLYGYLLKQINQETESSNQVLSDLDAMLRRLSTYLPADLSGRLDVQSEQILQELNIVFCELTSLLLLSPSASSRTFQRPSSARRVAPYIVRLLDGASTSGSTLARPVSSQAYTALLPSIWALANANAKSPDVTMDEDTDVLQATLRHALRTPSSSATKRASIEFIGRLVLLDTEQQCHNELRLSTQSAVLHNLIEEWIMHLPKTLWELAGRDSSTSEVIIRLLLRLTQRRAWYLTSEVTAGLIARLTPFFVVTHATRGQLPGPYAKMSPPSLKRLALDAVSTLLSDTTDGEGLAQAVALTIAGTAEGDYWTSIRAITVA